MNKTVLGFVKIKCILAVIKSQIKNACLLAAEGSSKDVDLHLAKCFYSPLACTHNNGHLRTDLSGRCREVAVMGVRCRIAEN